MRICFSVFVMRIVWDDTDLRVSEGDEIEILRGMKMDSGYDFDIRATVVRNLTRGGKFTSRIEGVLTSYPPYDFDPPVRGYVKNLEVAGSTYFEIQEKAPLIVSGIVRECKKFMDPQLYERCKDKDYHDVVTNAFTVLEERIRKKLNADPSFTGNKLIDYAFKPYSGKLAFGDTQSEKDAFYFLFRGALGLLRNPPAHRFTADEDEVEAFEIVCLVDLLLRIIDKSCVQN